MSIFSGSPFFALLQIASQLGSFLVQSDGVGVICRHQANSDGAESAVSSGVSSRGTGPSHVNEVWTEGIQLTRFPHFLSV